MSTIQGMALMLQAERALVYLSQAQAKLLSIRGQQLKECERERNMYAAGEVKVERENERLATRIEEICTHNALGDHGTPMEQLERLASALDSYDMMVTDQANRLTELKAYYENCKAAEVKS